VIHRSDYNGHLVAEKLSEMIYQFSCYDQEEIKKVRNNAAKIAEKALWKHFICFYDQAYQIALLNKEKRFSIKDASNCTIAND
jgi:hypothetical protein